ncbi:DNA polymerase [Veillonella sp. CAG:933]|uniref:DNA polymerase n=1 Tax=Veillonella sp. CAG:933 TaxID=1262980 RepID=UPI00263F8566|nr:DNA polymerase [Veillonella sp. CAG:933]
MTISAMTKTCSTKPQTLSIDVETYSEWPIKHSAQRYVDDPSFEILLFAYSFDDEPVEVVDMTTDPLPERVVKALHDPEITKTAFNANFEITALHKYYPDMDLQNWECTSVLALYQSLPTSLDAVSTVLGLSETKDKRGKDLIRFFSMPCRPTKTNGGRTRNLPTDAPDKWAEYIEYNRQDVVVEKAIRDKLIKLKPPEFEHRWWLVDGQINRNGIAIDKTLVNNAITFDAAIKAQLMAEARKITGLDNPNSPVQLKEWVEGSLGHEIPGITKTDVKELLKGSLPDDVRRVLEIRQQLGKTSIKKYEAMKNAVCSDGRIHGMLQYYGAMRTGRWAGRVVQLQNLPRNYLNTLDEARRIVKSGNLELLSALYDDVPDVLSQLIRTALVPADGCRFIVADYSAIEARVIAWLAGESWRQEVFAKNGDIYCASASSMFGIPVEKHGINGHLRQKGKVAELALGYGGGKNALIAMGALEGGIPEDELPDIVQKWRKASPKIVKFWYDVDAAAKQAIKEGRARIKQGGLRFRKTKGFLFILLPSGRYLAYAKPTIGTNRFGSPSIVYKGMSQTANKWLELETYGGKLVENIVQAVARDCLAAAMERLTLAGYKILAHIHDEVVIEAPIGTGSLDEVIKIMAEPTEWNKGLILDAAGFEANYYMKD